MTEPLALRCALEMVRRGFAVFPLRPGTKLPYEAKHCDERTRRLAGGINIATRDGGRVRRWFSIEPTLNYGVSTSEHVVLDFDAAHGKPGLDTLASLDLPHTLVVETPRYGQHWYFNGPGAGQRDIGPGVNVRSIGGYVVGPGCTFEGRLYKVKTNAPLADCPAHVREKLSKAGERQLQIMPADWDPPGSYDEAAAHLMMVAPAISGQNGNDTTYRVACQLRDKLLSPDAALDAMLLHYNPRCEPAWSVDELRRIIGNAYQYANMTPGTQSAAIDFGDVTPEDLEGLFAIASESPSAFRNMSDEPAAKIPKRKWLVKDMIKSRDLTALVAPPGAGKSTFALALAIGLATGSLDFLGLEIALAEPQRVIVVNNEDDEDEQRRRLHAICQHHGIDATLAIRNIFIHALPDESPFVAFRRVDKKVIKRDAKVYAEFEAAIERHKATAFILDPFAEVQEADEKDNSELIKVLKAIRATARKHDVAGILVHHTRKRPGASAESLAGDQETARGGSAFGGAVRGMYTLYEMTKREAEDYGLTEKERRRYSRLDRAKGNHTSPDADTRWFRTETVVLDNGDTAPAVEVAKLQSREEREARQRQEIGDVLVPLLDGEGGIKLAAAAAAIVKSPFMKDLSKAAIKARLKAMFAEPVEVNGWRLGFAGDEIVGTKLDEA